jgi:lysophospholipase L1-like esterase
MLHPAQNPFPWLLAPILLTQGLWVKARTLRLPEASGPRSGSVGSGSDLRLVAIGDSIIAGVGVDTTAQALPAELAGVISDQLNRRVHWSSHGHNGARTQDLLGWPAEPDWRDADLVIISNGLNDVTGLMAMRPWLEEKKALLQRLRTLCGECLIAQLGLPPLGHFPALPNPLRWVMGRRAAAFDQALAQLIGELPNTVHVPFSAVPEPELFAPDGYHPGPEAIGIWARELARVLAPLLGTRDS